MKMSRIGLPVCAAGIFLFGMTARTQDADHQKLTEIENAFASTVTPGPESETVCKQYLYDGPLNQVTLTGRVGVLPKSTILPLCAKPDPTDPDVKSTSKLSDIHVDVYGDTAVVSYKQTNVDTGHKDATLNATYDSGCLDTFVKRNGAWFVISNACTPSKPLPAAEWAAIKKQISQEPKDLQQAYH